MDFRDTLAVHEPFTTSGALRGVSMPYSVSMGHLPSQYHESARKAHYVVYSYNTPIAWYVPTVGWVTPNVRYSVTTSRHQSKVFTAISQIG
jgi:hypothetical protein